ncbi:MAG: DNA-binding response regulator [Candidatus Electrothrix sp. AX2]|jgi:DNA-binding NarL/FixJ family response regulator|nr:DNA-binding response regulator [Candidatus Electrothrix gigas]
MYRIILADDHYLIRNGIKTMIAQEAGLQVIAEAADGQELLDILKENQPDMVILDISMPQVNGIEALKQIHALYPEIRMLVLTMHSNIQYCYHALSAGAHGYLLKDDSATELLPAILQVRDGKVYVSPQLAPEFSWQDEKIQLTPREKEVLEMVVKGLTTKKIAEKFCLSPRTVEHHRSNILKKFKKKNSVDLINYVVKNPYILYW